MGRRVQAARQRGGTTSRRRPNRVCAQSTRLKLARFTPFKTCIHTPTVAELLFIPVICINMSSECHCRTPLAPQLQQLCSCAQFLSVDTGSVKLCICKVFLCRPSCAAWWDEVVVMCQLSGADSSICRQVLQLSVVWSLQSQAALLWLLLKHDIKQVLTKPLTSPQLFRTLTGKQS